MLLNYFNKIKKTNNIIGIPHYRRLKQNIIYNNIIDYKKKMFRNLKQ